MGLLILSYTYIHTYIQGICKAPFHIDHGAEMEIKKKGKQKQKQQTETKQPDH